jgi:hypothetical protein
LLVFIIIEIPELLFGFPPFDHATETGDGKEDLHIPVPSMPVWMVVPGLTDGLYSLNE